MPSTDVRGARRAAAVPSVWDTMTEKVTPPGDPRPRPPGVQDEDVGGPDLGDVLTQSYLAPPGTGLIVRRQVAGVVRHAFSRLDLLAELETGWGFCRELVDARDATRASPGSIEHVAIDHDGWAVGHDLDIDVFVGDALLTTVRVNASVRISTEYVGLDVADGVIVRVTSGVATATGALRVDEELVREGRLRLDLSDLVHVDTRIGLPGGRHEPPDQRGPTD